MICQGIPGIHPLGWFSGADLGLEPLSPKRVDFPFIIKVLHVLRGVDPVYASLGEPKPAQNGLIGIVVVILNDRLDLIGRHESTPKDCCIASAAHGSMF